MAIEIFLRLATRNRRRINRRRSQTRLMGVALMMVATAGVFGCGESDGYDRLPISGAVTLDGQPLQHGYVVFEPKAGQPTQSGGMIEGGKFTVPRENGPVAGLYSVAIFSGAEAPKGVEVATPEADRAARKAKGEMVPRKYNIDSTLTAEVKPGDPNAFEFHLTAQEASKK